MRNLKYLGLLISLHMAIFFAFIAAMIVGIPYLPIIIYVSKYILAKITVGVAYRKLADKCNLLVIPFSFFLLPVVYILFSLIAFNLLISLVFDTSGWMMFVMIDAMIFSAPFGVQTLVSSSVAESKKSYVNPKIKGEN